MTVKYPEIKVKLTGEDGNAFHILGTVTRAMRKAGYGDKETKAFVEEATKGDYDHLLRTAMKTVEVT